jgi:hypothetical protein
VLEEEIRKDGLQTDPSFFVRKKKKVSNLSFAMIFA